MPPLPTFPELNRLSDDEVMVYLQRGADDALAVLFLRFHRLVLSICLKILHDTGEAEDCAQAIFMELFRSPGQFDSTKGNTKVWLVHCAYHKAINRKRYLRVRNFYANAETPEAGSPAEQPEPDASGAFATVEARKMIESAFDCLTAAQQTTLELAFFDGLSMREISERTSEPVGNVRHHYYRGLERLRAAMTRETPQAPERDSLHRGIVDAEA